MTQTKTRITSFYNLLGREQCSVMIKEMRLVLCQREQCGVIKKEKETSTVSKPIEERKRGVL